MTPAFLLHADDIGLSPCITTSILRSIDEGYVRSVSLICNGTAFEEAVAALAARPEVRVSLHLNLLEGRPLSGAGDIPLLLDAHGQLAATFQKLARLWVQGDDGQRAALNDQIDCELSAQITRGRTALAAAGRAPEPLRIDSHTHVHALGFVLDAVLNGPESHRIGYVRVPCEPWHTSRSSGDWRSVMGLNSVKWALLKRLSAPMRSKLSARGIAFNPGFLGILHTGRMTVSAIEAGIAASIKSLEQASLGDGGPVEVLLHPGKAGRQEEDQWSRRPELWSYYRAANRDLEGQTARNIGQAPVAANFTGA